MSPQYGHVMLVSGYPILIAVNWPYCEFSNIKNVDLPRRAWDTPPFLLIVSPTLPVQSVDAYVRSVTWQPNKKRLTIFHAYGALSHARFARGEPRYQHEVRPWISHWNSKDSEIKILLSISRSIQNRFPLLTLKALVSNYKFSLCVSIHFLQK